MGAKNASAGGGVAYVCPEDTHLEPSPGGGQECVQNYDEYGDNVHPGYWGTEPTPVPLAAGDQDASEGVTLPEDTISPATTAAAGQVYTGMY